MTEDFVRLARSVRAARRTIDRSRHSATHRLDVELIFGPARALDFDFHGRCLAWATTVNQKGERE